MQDFFIPHNIHMEGCGSREIDLNYPIKNQMIEINLAILRGLISNLMLPNHDYLF